MSKEYGAKLSRHLIECTSMKTAVELIVKERERQIKDEGYDTQHDDMHSVGELAMAAASYAIPPMLRPAETAPLIFPWMGHAWKPTPRNRIRELTKAGALIVAEIERVQRLNNK